MARSYTAYRFVGVREPEDTIQMGLWTTDPILWLQWYQLAMTNIAMEILIFDR